MKPYYRLIKPGIVYSNAMSALAAFVFASHGTINPQLLTATLVGLGCVIASACVINNVMDRDIDQYMERTKNRALVTGTISVRNALLFAVVLGVIGCGALLFYTNAIALSVALFGAVVYLVLYTPLKRTTRHSTIIGTLSGAVPPVVGYTAVTNALDVTALLLFLVLICWQMVHFLSIAIFRVDDYRAAELPVIPVSTNITRTKALMIVYAFLFAGTIGVLWYVAALGNLFIIPMGALSIAWILLALRGIRTPDNARWARTMFFYSIAVLLTFCLTLALS